MNTEEIFEEMAAYDFSNLDLELPSNDNCYCHCDSGDCDSCDFCDG